MTEIGAHAVVLGASMAGLMAARVLAESYRHVTVVERDVFGPGAAGPRRGAPQGRHAHVMALRGGQIADELFPGLSDDLIAAGAPIVDDADMSKLDLSFGGHRLVRTGNFPHGQDFPVLYASRPLLESSMRRRLGELANITILDGHDVLELTTDAQRARVTGARVAPRDGEAARTLSADLVVDATGRGSRTPAFLDGLGYGRPAEDEVVVHLVYVTQWLRIPPGMLAPNLVIVAATPDRPTGMALIRHENDTWSCTLAGMLGVEPPRDREGALEFAADFVPGYVMNALRAAELLGELSHFRVPSNRWRRYDKLARIPQGLLVFGDAICSFNPVYGQGMSVAAMEAIALRDCLRDGGHDLPQRFSRAAAKVVAVAWQMAAGSDLAMPGVPGRRSLAMRLINRYTDHVLRAAESDRFVAERFIRVAQFIDPPAALMTPSILLRVATADRRREPAALEPSVSAPA